jgi:hypothetical protein
MNHDEANSNHTGVTRTWATVGLLSSYKEEVYSNQSYTNLASIATNKGCGIVCDT